MPRADEYRLMADECLQWAQDARTKDERILYLKLAQTWLEEASRNNGALHVHLPPAPRL
jgi:hypothetical protein